METSILNDLVVKHTLIFTFLLCFCISPVRATHLSPLAETPDWSTLDPYQETILRDEFVSLLDTLYAPHDAWKKTISVTNDHATIQTGKKTPYILRFAADTSSRKPIRRFWRGRNEIPPRPKDRLLKGIRIAIDPGHIGGKWAKMEERWFQIGRSTPVQEGDMTLLVAKKLADRLKALGADVSLVRTKTEPQTRQRPKKLRKEAIISLHEQGKRATPGAIQKESEKLFYRTAEIRARAQKVNSHIRPDLTLCLHFNAEDWGNQNHPTLTDKNHLHLLVSGAYAESELAYDDQRLEMLHKLLSRSGNEEIGLALSMADQMQKKTHLSPYTYISNKAVPIAQSPYVWGRNLLANRIYQSPVVYIEPYVMNSHEVFARIQKGDYPGKQKIQGVPRESIFQEYTESVVSGLIDYFSKP